MPEPPEDHAMSSKKQKSAQKSTSPHNAFHQPFRAVAMDLKAQMKREEADKNLDQTGVWQRYQQQ